MGLVSLLKFFKGGLLPSNGSNANYFSLLGPQCFIENGILWRTRKLIIIPTRTVLVVLHSICVEIVKEAHGSFM
jgi:hypothetical protein